MANEADTGKVITVQTPFPEDISWVYKNQTFSDIILHCNREKVHAHKVILATRCPHFRSVLVEDPKVSELTIDDVSVEAFRKIIQYIYTGTLVLMSLDTPLIFEVMKLACKFSLKNLELKISEEISSIIDTENVLGIFNQAIMYDMEGLKNKCYTFIDECPFEILENDSIHSLTQKSMVSLLERGSLNVSEIDIFRSVQRWCEVNNDNNNLVVNCVRLNRLSNDEILKVVFPSNLIENQKLLEILAQSVDEKPTLLQFENAKSTMPQSDDEKSKLSQSVDEKTFPQSADENSESPNPPYPLNESENLASEKHGAQVISGENTTWLLSDSVGLSWGPWAFHWFNDKEGITIKLKKSVWVNHMEITLSCDEFYSYYIETSQDQKTWQRVIDYSRYHCCYSQYLYFDKTIAQYFRIVGTRNCTTSKNAFELSSFKLYWKSNTPKVKNGIVCPKENIVSRGFIIFRVDNVVLPLWETVFSASSSIIIYLHQPYWISNIRIRRKKDCGYNIQTSWDQVSWEEPVAINCQECPFWRKFTFQERCVVYVKITLEKIPSSRSVDFHLTDFEIPSNT